MRVRSKAFAAFSLLLASSLFAGCLGGDDDMDGENHPDIESFADGLRTQIRLPGQDTSAWFEPGTTVDVEAVEPEDAVGNVSYTWAIQDNRWRPTGDRGFPEPNYNTSTLAPGESTQIIFEETGYHDAGHCHYHPTQTQSVAVIDDYDGPDHVVSYIYERDLADPDSYKFYPEHLTVGVGTVVEYINIGDLQHTFSSHDWPIPPVRTLDIDGPSGQVTLEGADYVDLLLFVEDEAGNGGAAELRLFVREKFDDYQVTNEGSFEAFIPEVMDSSEDTFDHTFQWSGTVHLNVTLPGEVNTLNEIDVELFELDSAGNRVAMIISENATGEETFSASFTTAIPRNYELAVRPAQGLLIDYKVELSVDYDYTPPEFEALPCPEPHYSLGHC